MKMTKWKDIKHKADKKKTSTLPPITTKKKVTLDLSKKKIKKTLESSSAKNVGTAKSICLPKCVPKCPDCGFAPGERGSVPQYPHEMDMDEATQKQQNATQGLASATATLKTIVYSLNVDELITLHKMQYITKDELRAFIGLGPKENNKDEADSIEVTSISEGEELYRSDEDLSGGGDECNASDTEGVELSAQFGTEVDS